MIDLGPHAVFIVWAYIGVGIAVAGVVGGTLWSARNVKARLALLQAQGIGRRSADRG